VRKTVGDDVGVEEGGRTVGSDEGAALTPVGTAVTIAIGD